MSILRLTLRWLLMISLGLILYYYLNNFSPYREDGSLDSLMIFVVFSILAVLTFFILQTLGTLFYKPHLANRLAFIGSFMLIQIMLISSGGFLNLNSALIIVGFNLFIFWYALKIL